MLRSSSARRRQRSTRGITLLEMLVVAAILGLLAAVSFPSVASGLESLRLTSAASGIVSFLSQGLNRAERRQIALEVSISKTDNLLVMQSMEPGFERRLAMPAGVTIQAVLPEEPGLDPDQPRRFLLLPGGTAPRFGVVIANRRGERRTVRVDPITGAPAIEREQESGK